MFNKMLIANRGSLRISCIYVAQELGIKSVVFHSAEDLQGVGEQLADEVKVLSAEDPFSAYYNQQAILDLATEVGADCVHPGYGILADNVEFKRELEARGISLISGSALLEDNTSADRQEAEATVCEKPKLKELVRTLGIESVEGSKVCANLAQLKEAAQEIPSPWIVKPVTGVGGQGVELVQTEGDLDEAFASCQERARRLGFAPSGVFVEQYLPEARHIEVPVLRDKSGNVSVLPELDCSVQRLFQKMVVQSPAPGLDEGLRRKLATLSRRLVEELNFIGLAYVEFLVLEGVPYFLELNTYIQPSHAVTSRITGINLLKEHLRVMAGMELSVPTAIQKARGSAVGFSLNAEDPSDNFRPSPGVIEEFSLYAGVGVDVLTTCFRHKTLSSFYDPMMAYVVVSAQDRDELQQRLEATVNRFYVDGVKTNLLLLRAVFNSEQFRNGQFAVGLLEDNKRRSELIDALKGGQEELAAVLAALSMQGNAQVENFVAEASSDQYALWNFAARFFQRGKMEI